jgi:TonB-linked SusC/RagA family outer membrane protein
MNQFPVKAGVMLLLTLLPFFAFSQSRPISGTVTDDRGEPLAGVSVLEKNTSNGTTTNARGNFSLTVSGASPVLVLSYSGRTTQEIPVTAASVYNVSMGAAGKLSEVVVTALGIRRSERSLGYATQQVKGDNLTLTKEQNVIGSLAGKIAGVQVVGASGASMGGTQKIRIRGTNSLQGNDQPLVVVDGTPISNANFAGSDRADYGNIAQDINPEDIESVNVLKGPAASALYGLRGQYGVIMITTKKGARGAKKVQVQVNAALSMEKAGNFMPLQNLYGGGSRQTWTTLTNGQKVVEVGVDESWGPRMDGTPVRQFYSFFPQDPDFGKETPFLPFPNNVEDYYQTGINSNNGITVMGGGENSSFRLSFNDTRITGVEPNTWLRRNNIGLNASLDLTRRLTVSTNINFATNSAQRPAQGSEYGARYMVQWFQRNVDMNRLKAYRYPDGTFINWNIRPIPASGIQTDLRPRFWDNPFFEAYENLSNDSRDRIFGDVGLSFEVIKGFKISGNLRGDLYTQNIEERIAFGGRRLPSYAVGKYQGRELNYELLGQYNTNWGDLSLNANVGGNLFSTTFTSLYMATVGGLSSPGYYNIRASVDRPTTLSTRRAKQIRSAFAMASLGYKNTYFFDASIRNDISSALPEANNSYWYPSLSTSIVFSELVRWKPLSFAKLRLSYAQAGSDASPYNVNTVFNPGTVYANTAPGGITANTMFVPDVLNNPNLQPSFAHSYEAGVDLRFFNNRLGIDLTYYLQRNRNQIIDLPISGTSGFATAVINAGLIENKGIELAISGSPIRGRHFSWETNFNIARNRNQVVELYPGVDVYSHGSTTYSSVTSHLITHVGKSYGRLIGQGYQRDSATGKILLGTNNLPLFTPATMDFGSVLPDFTGGFLNRFRIWKVELSAMIDFQAGGKFFSRSQMLAVRTGQHALTAELNDKGKNVRDAVADGGGVRVDGISAATKQPVTAYVDAKAYWDVVGRRIYEEWIYDASFIKLRELRIGYTFDKQALGRLPFTSVSLALIARNPLMIWQKAPKGLDPSEMSTGSQSIGWYESGQSNTVRSYGLNLNINF